MKLLVIPALAALSSAILVQNLLTQDADVRGIKTSVVQVQSIAEVDRTRRSAIRKVLAILNKHNPELQSRLKLAIADEIYEACQKYPNLDVDLVCATITHESARSWNPSVVSRAGAMGLMQIMPATGKWLAKYEDIVWTSAEEVLFDPISNIRLGSRYLAALIETYDLEGGLAAYNGGARRAEMWLAQNKAKGVLWAETSRYVPFVLKIYEEYRDSSL